MALGTWFNLIMLALAQITSKNTMRNLEVCFPEWSPVEVEAQAKQVFVDMMLGVFETLNAWYCPNWFKGRH